MAAKSASKEFVKLRLDPHQHPTFGRQIHPLAIYLGFEVPQDFHHQLMQFIIALFDTVRRRQHKESQE